MQLTRKLVTKIAIAVVVLIVFGFIIWKFTSKSTYSVESITTGQGADETTLYTGLATCQNTFTEATLSVVNIHDTISCQNGIVSVKSLLPHEYNTNDKIFVQGVSTDGTLGDVTVGYNTSTNPVTVTKVDTYNFTYPSIGTCSDSSRISTNGKGYSWSETNNATVSPLNNTRVECITTKIQTFMDTKCPYTTTPPTSGVQLTAYNTYKANIAIIEAAYARKVSLAPTLPTAGKATADQFKAAREADYTAATRKYLLTVCPDYYRLTNNIDPATTTVDRLPNTPYTNYVADTTDTTGIGFNASLVTDENVLNWAKYASTVDSNKQSSTYLQFTGTTALVTPSVYDKTYGGNIYPIGTPNWKIAQDIGPGTITSLGPLPGTTLNGAAVSSTIQMNSTTAP